MYGIEAITTHNGWAMSLAGVLIVFAGLVILSTTIAQLHKVLNFFENSGAYHQRRADRLSKNGPAETPAPSLQIPPALHESARQYKLITSRIGEPFSLPKLVKLAGISGMPNPHATINDFLQASLIVPNGQGYFLWNK